MIFQSTFAQKGEIQDVSPSLIKNKKPIFNSNKTTTCDDDVLPIYNRTTGLAWGWDISPNGGVGMIFPYNGSGTITSLFTLARSTAGGLTNVPVTVKVYEIVGSTFNLLGSQVTTFSDNPNFVFSVDFDTPVQVDGDYFVEIVNNDPTNKLQFALNAAGDGAEEYLALWSFNVNHYYVYDGTTDFDRDWYFIPSISNAVTADFSVSLGTVTTGTPVTFTNNSVIDNAGYHNAYSYATTPATDLFVWNFNDGSSLETTTNATHSFANCGTYNVSLTANYVKAADSTLCFETKTFTITVKDDIQIAGTPTATTACGATDGAVNLTSSVGSNAGDLAWTGTASSSVTGISLPYDVTGLAAGTYNFTLTDAKNCTSQVASITVADQGAPTIGASEDDPILCNGGQTTATIAVVTGNITGYTFTWTKAGNTVGTGTNATALTAGLYDINGTNGTCNTSTSITITEPATVVTIASGVVSNVTNTTTPDGGVNVTSNGGTGTLTYAWANSTAPTTVIATTEDLANVAAGTYVLTVTDANGCTATANYTIVSVAGINDLSINDLKVYPNPVSGVLNVEATNIKEVQVLDMFGKVILATEVNANAKSIDLSSFANGAYFVNIITNDAQQVVKINLTK